MFMRGKKKVIKRKPRGGAAPQDFYFNAGTQEAIVQYKLEQDPKKRNAIYVTSILPAFNKLVENLINVYGFHVQYENKLDLMNECVEFLYGTVTKYDPTRGTKAFSYFNVIAKHWLIIKSKQSVKQQHVLCSLDDTDRFTAHDLETIENYSVAPSPEDVLLNEHEKARLKAIIGRVGDMLATDNERVCYDGISTLFATAEELDFLNKRAVMIYLREMTSLHPKMMSTVLSTLRKYYVIAKEEYDLGDATANNNEPTQ